MSDDTPDYIENVEEAVYRLRDADSEFDRGVVERHLDHALRSMRDEAVPKEDLRALVEKFKADMREQEDMDRVCRINVERLEELL